MNIKKIKVGSIFVNEEKEITAKATGKKYKLCEVNVKVADDCPSGYAGKYMKTSIFAYVNDKDASKNKSAKNQAEYFKTQNEGKEMLVDVTEEKWIGSKDGVEHTSLKFKTLSKAQKAIAEQFVK